jgi:DNA-binding beta-propeller fold protein YncE
LQDFGAGRPVDLAADPNTGLLFVSARDCPPDESNQKPDGCLLAVNPRNGALVKSIALTGVPADLRVDTDLGLAYVAIPKDQTVVEVDVRGLQRLRTINGMPQVTSLAIDPIRHELYVSHLGGQVTVVDSSSATVAARISVTGAGLTSVATARGLAYAVNTATHELAVIDPNAQGVARYVLPDEPAAIAAAEDTGAVYVLTSRGDFILQVDPIGGNVLGKVIVSDRTGHSTLRPGDPASLRPRLVLDSTDDELFASLPEAGSLAAVANESFPVLAREIPYAATSDQLAVAADIPEVLQPGLASGGPVSAQGH